LLTVELGLLRRPGGLELDERQSKRTGQVSQEVEVRVPQRDQAQAVLRLGRQRTRQTGDCRDHVGGHGTVARDDEVVVVGATRRVGRQWRRGRPIDGGNH
jgi:hypothetical protein